MEQTKIYVELSDELQEVLNDNGISIKDILEQEGIEADVTYGVMPTQAEEGARSKDLVPIILASGVSLSAVILASSVAISNVLSALYRKPYLVEYEELVSVLDPNGEVLRDKEGEPIRERVKRYKLVEPSAADYQQSLGIDLPNWFVLGFRSSVRARSN